jgi:group II intron reverse transcriptase/maturase
MTGNPTRPLRKTPEEEGNSFPERVERRRGKQQPMTPAKKWPRWEGRKLHSLMPFVTRRKTLAAAWDEVRANRGAPGVDGESVDEFGAEARERLWELSEALRTKTWRPKPLRRVWIPKPDGTKRGLGIPCVEDRVVHRAVAKVLYGVFEDEFGPDCYAYVKGRNALEAVERVQREAGAGKRWVVETDVKKFFDTIDRKALADKLAERIADGSLLRLVSAIVRSGVLCEVDENEAGVPQGSPLSPLLANIYLAGFDRRIGSRWTLIRYADDLVVMCRTREEAERAKDEVEAALRDEGLSMKPEKTRVVHMNEGVEFLGYRLTSWKAEPSAKSVKRFKEKVRALTRRHDTRPVEEVVKRLMPAIRGWTNHFQLSKPSKVWPLGTWILERLKAYVVKHRWRGAWSRDAPTEKLYGMGLRLPYHLLTGWSP